MTFDLHKFVSEVEVRYRAEFDPEWHSDKLKDPAYKARFIEYLQSKQKEEIHLEWEQEWTHD